VLDLGVRARVHRANNQSQNGRKQLTARLLLDPGARFEGSRLTIDKGQSIILYKKINNGQEAIYNNVQEVLCIY
jgi:hypothetical protein